jgi:hypothetical protein
MKPIFLFGRGGRGSRQRVFVQVLSWGGLMRVHEVVIGIRPIVGSDIRIVRIGTSVLDGKRRVFFTSQISRTFQAIRQAARDFRTIRKVNKIKIDKPKKQE